MHELTTTTGIVALAAAGLALVVLIFAIVLAVKMRRVREAQSAVLGDLGKRDLVTHAEQINSGFVQLRDWVEDAHAKLDERMRIDEERTDACIAHVALVRYDAYGEMSGQQSSSLALLDTRRSGVVVSSILHREQARVYVKQIHEGQSQLELSPEEQEAIDTALGATRA
jgi:hypothetical protein